MNMNIRALPRAAVAQSLHAARLPLDVVERFANRDDRADWGPTVAFEAFEATVLRAAAALLRDPELREQADLQTAKVAQLRRAGELETGAEAIRATADAELEQRRDEAQTKRVQSERAAKDRETQIEVDRRQAEQRVQARKDQEAAEARAQAERRQEQIDKRERRARAQQLRAERDALAERQKAVAAKDRVAQLDDAVQAANRRRKAG